MKTIFKWLFSSFFRSIGRWLGFIFLFIFISYIGSKFINWGDMIPKIDYQGLIWNKTYKLTSNYEIKQSLNHGWASGYTMGDTSQWVTYKCPNNSNCNSSVINSQYYTLPSQDSNFPLFYMRLFNVTSNSYGFALATNSLISENVLYSTSLAVCSNDGSSFENLDFKTFVTDDLTNVRARNYDNYFTSYTTATNTPYDNPDNNSPTGTWCRVFRNIWSSSSSGRFQGFKFRGNLSNYNLDIIGFKNEVLGNISNLTSSQVEDIVNNSITSATSNLVTTQSLASSTNEIKNKIEEENKKTSETITYESEKTRETLTDNTLKEEDSDISNLNQDGMDKGPLESIIQLPITMISTITSSNCTPLRLSLPGINKTLVLPCMKDYFWNRLPSGVNTLIHLIYLGVISWRILNAMFKVKYETTTTGEPELVKTIEL